MLALSILQSAWEAVAEAVMGVVNLLSTSIIVTMSSIAASVRDTMLSQCCASGSVFPGYIIVTSTYYYSRGCVSMSHYCEV